ncbi:S8 family serine peptidase, partial [Candidatus Saccharibacteria bacterium]|nr:S8 family serine peptidase [Candidatus Saccharibacteria bacterium]
RRASFSSYGPNLDLLAPGTAGEVCGAIYNNTTPNTGYSCSYSGTSLSAPIVSGTVSLLRQHFSQAGVTDIISSITRGAVRVENMLNNDFTVTEGFGRLNPVSSIGLLSIKAPGGLLISKHIASIGSAERLNSTCLGYPGSICQIIFNNGNGQTISLPSQTVLSQQPGLPYASWSWSPIELGIPKGKWTVQAQSTFDNQIIYSASDTLTIQ